MGLYRTDTVSPLFCLLQFSEDNCSDNTIKKPECCHTDSSYALARKITLSTKSDHKESTLLSRDCVRTSVTCNNRSKCRKIECRDCGKPFPTPCSYPLFLKGRTTKNHSLNFCRPVFISLDINIISFSILFIAPSTVSKTLANISNAYHIPYTALENDLLHLLLCI